MIHWGSGMSQTVLMISFKRLSKDRDEGSNGLPRKSLPTWADGRGIELDVILRNLGRACGVALECIASIPVRG